MLPKLDSILEKIERENILSKLAIDGGDIVLFYAAHRTNGEEKIRVRIGDNANILIVFELFVPNPEKEILEGEDEFDYQYFIVEFPINCFNLLTKSVSTKTKIGHFGFSSVN